MNLDLSKYQDRLMTFPELIDYILSIPENDMYDCTFKENVLNFKFYIFICLLNIIYHYFKK